MAENRYSKKINFYKPDKRFIIPIHNFHIPRKLLNEYKKQKYNFLINNNFDQVIQNCCKAKRKDQGTWINEIIIETYKQLNYEGYAHSIECYKNENLIGGLYGLKIGSCFFGESMFSLVSNASKLCLLYLITILIKNNFILLDSQFYNSHLLQFGAYEVNDDDYQNILKEGLNKKTFFPQELTIQNSFNIIQSLSHKS